MRFTVKKMDEIKKSLSMIEENLLNAYVKVGTKKLFVHKNTLYTDPNFTKIAGHFQDGMAILKHKKKSKLIRSKSKTSVKSNSNNSNNSRRMNGLYKNSNKEILSESEPEMESIASENGNRNGNQNGNRKRNGNGYNSFEKVKSESVESEESPVQSEESPVQSEESSEPDSPVQSESSEESAEKTSSSNTNRM